MGVTYIVRLVLYFYVIGKSLGFFSITTAKGGVPNPGCLMFSKMYMGYIQHAGDFFEGTPHQHAPGLASRVSHFAYGLFQNTTWGGGFKHVVLKDLPLFAEL